MRRRSRTDDDAPGQDSFLDIVANLVGILIILVMIVGARAKDAMIEAEHEPVPVAEVDVETPKNASVAVRQDLENLVQKMQHQEIEIAYRRNERDRILTVITTAEKALEEQRGSLGADARAAHELQLSLAAAERQLEDLKLSRDAIERSTAPVSVIRHRPTPLAKTVFGREIHFQLKNGHVVFVPIDELVEKFKAEAKEKAWKLRDAPRITETVGPVRGFRLKYTLKRANYNIETRAGTVMQQRVELDYFVLVPVSDDLGEPYDAAIRPDSEMRAVLGGLDPNQTTVTVWVYPDSFEEFRLLKEELYQLGFLTASRPMPEGQPISGSPQGTRSAVQ